MGEKQLSTAEAELYDRQIRLWGIESQEKLRAANILLIGIRALGSEIAKNILLSGINSLTILDDSAVTEKDIQTNFLINNGCKIGNKIAEEVLLKAQALNPLVKITPDVESLNKKDSKYFQSFTLVVATEIKFDQIIRIDGVCREHNVKFIYGDVFGYFGFAISDLQEHSYFEDRVQLTEKRSHDGEKKVVKVKGNMSYPALNKILILPNTKQDTSSIKKISRPNNLFVCMLALIQFRKKFERNPGIDTQLEDIKALTGFATDIIELYKLSNIKADELNELLFTTVTPVSAILGGVIAQEIIKAVSQKEVPINNIFLFDPVTYSGKELTVGA